MLIGLHGKETTHLTLSWLDIIEESDVSKHLLKVVTLFDTDHLYAKTALIFCQHLDSEIIGASLHWVY